MTELEKIEYAKSFIDKLANGINPLDDSPIPDNDIANNVRLCRLLSKYERINNINLGIGEISDAILFGAYQGKRKETP